MKEKTASNSANPCPASLTDFVIYQILDSCFLFFIQPGLQIW